MRRSLVHRTAVLALLMVGGWPTTTARADAPADVRVGRIPVASAGAAPIDSSSRLAVSWTRPDRAHHLVIVARESLQGTEVRASVAADVTSVTLSGLRAATAYAVTVAACDDATCTRPDAAAEVEQATETEYWQLQGTGRGVERLTTLVSDGNARLSATRFGADAGDMAGYVQLYYGPMPRDRRQTLAAGVASGRQTPRRRRRSSPSRVARARVASRRRRRRHR